MSHSKIPFQVAVLLSFVAAGAAQTIQDRDLVDFEGESQPIVLATLDGLPTTATLTLTADPDHVHDGSGALELSYHRLDGTFPAIVHPALMTDLDRFDHWIKSEQDATWLLQHKDRDDAVFVALIDLPAGQPGSSPVGAADELVSGAGVGPHGEPLLDRPRGLWPDRQSGVRTGRTQQPAIGDGCGLR